MAEETLILLQMTVYSSEQDAALLENIVCSGRAAGGEESKIKQLLGIQCHWHRIFCFHEIASPPWWMSLSVSLHVPSHRVLLQRSEKDSDFFWQIWSWITTKQQAFISIWRNKQPLPAVGLCCSLAMQEIYGGSNARELQGRFLFSAKGIANPHSILTLN